MAAKKKPIARKSASRKSTAKKAAKARKAGVTTKKAAKPRKKPAINKKPAAVKKAARARPASVAPASTELDGRIAIVRANLRELVEQAASSAGAANEELMSQRIAEQEEKLRLLMKEREG